MSSLAGFGYDIGIEAEDGGDHEGKLPSLVYIAWENGDDMKNLANFFTLTRGAVAISEAQCITHKVSTYSEDWNNRVGSNNCPESNFFQKLYTYYVQAKIAYNKRPGY